MSWYYCQDCGDEWWASRPPELCPSCDSYAVAPLDYDMELDDW